MSENVSLGVFIENARLVRRSTSLSLCYKEQGLVSKCEGSFFQIGNLRNVASNAIFSYFM